MACSLKAKRVDSTKWSTLKNYISSILGKIGQREKGSGNPTIIEQRGIRQKWVEARRRRVGVGL